jgi:anti-sigma B factor antagonist
VTGRLQLAVTNADDASLLTVSGEVDMDSSPDLLKALRDGVHQGRPMVVDLAGVAYMDSSGIAVLIQGLRAAKKRGVEFRLRAPSKPVLAVLRLAQLLQLFNIDAGAKV